MSFPHSLAPRVLSVHTYEENVLLMFCCVVFIKFVDRHFPLKISDFRIIVLFKGGQDFFYQIILSLISTMIQRKHLGFNRMLFEFKTYKRTHVLK